MTKIVFLKDGFIITIPDVIICGIGHKLRIDGREGTIVMIAHVCSEITRPGNSTDFQKIKDLKQVETIINVL